MWRHGEILDAKLHAVIARMNSFRHLSVTNMQSHEFGRTAVRHPAAWVFTLRPRVVQLTSL
jgi:hypothetical protein